MALSLIYDPRGQTFEYWSSLMVEAYAGQQLIINSTEENWVEWAERLVGVIELDVNSLPMPHTYDKWNDWAEALMGVVNQKVQ